MSLLRRREPTPAEGGGMDVDGHPRCRRRLFVDEEDGGGEGGDEGQQPGAMDNLANVLQEEMRKARDTAKERWNFDFENERPLEGRWQWEAVGAAATTEGGSDPPSTMDDDQSAAEKGESPPPAAPNQQSAIDTPPSR